MSDFKAFKEKVHAPKQSKMAGDWTYRIERNISARISYFLLSWFPKLSANIVSGLSLFIVCLVTGGLFVRWSIEIVPYVAIIGLFLLYLIVYTDKIDGEIARATNRLSQHGVYLDRFVHALYPFVFYGVVGLAFYSMKGDVRVLLGTFLVAVLTHQYLFFADTIQAIKVKVDNGMKFFDPVIDRKKPLQGGKIRNFLEYLTFMIYLWTLFFYVGVFVVALFDLTLAWYLYLGHITWTTVRLIYYLFYRNPRYGLLKDVGRK